MNSSVKFLEPTLTVTSPLEDLLSISFPFPPLLLEALSLLSSPHAATSTAPASAAIAAIRARAKLRLISARSYSWSRQRGTVASQPTQRHPETLSPFGDTARCKVAKAS